MPPSDQRGGKASQAHQGHAIFARGDIRNLLRVALAMFQVDSPTLNNLAKATGHVKSGVLRDIERLQAQLGVVVEKKGSEYLLQSWGPVLKSADGLEQFLNQSIAEAN